MFFSHKFYPDIGGIEVNSELLAGQFSKAGHHVRMATWTEQPGEKSFSFEVIRAPGYKTLFGLHKWADVVYENNPCLRLSWPNILVNRPSVVALRTWIARMDGRISWQDKLKNRWLAKAQGVIAVSNAVRLKSWPDAVVIGNPYRSELFISEKTADRSIPFVFLGRLVSDKGVDVAIKAMAELKADPEFAESKTLLTIIGDGSGRAELESMARELGLAKKIHFTGNLSGTALVDMLNKHRYLLVPSVWAEPFGNVALEGMACGLLPFVSDTGGLPDAIGKGGVTFTAGSHSDLISKIRETIANSDLELEILRLAVEHLEQHRPEVIAAKYLEVLQKSIS